MADPAILGLESSLIGSIAKRCALGLYEDLRSGAVTLPCTQGRVYVAGRDVPVYSARESLRSAGSCASSVRPPVVQLRNLQDNLVHIACDERRTYTFGSRPHFRTELERARRAGAYPDADVLCAVRGHVRERDGMLFVDERVRVWRTPAEALADVDYTDAARTRLFECVATANDDAPVTASRCAYSLRAVRDIPLHGTVRIGSSLALAHYNEGTLYVRMDAPDASSVFFRGIGSVVLNSPLEHERLTLSRVYTLLRSAQAQQHFRMEAFFSRIARFAEFASVAQGLARCSLLRECGCDFANVPLQGDLDEWAARVAASVCGRGACTHARMRATGECAHVHNASKALAAARAKLGSISAPPHVRFASAT